MKQWCEVDLETLGTRPGCVVLSLGACTFDVDGIGETFYAVLNMQEQVALGAHVDPSTVAWWQKQSESAREVLDEARTCPVSARFTLEQFSAWWVAQGCKHFTANGSDFDGPILAEAYRILGLTPPWKFYNSRCHRTMKELFRTQVPEPEREGVAHRADHDAAHQARHASAILAHLRDLNTEQRRKEDLPHYGHGRVDEDAPHVEGPGTYSHNGRYYLQGVEVSYAEYVASTPAPLSVGDAIAKIRKGGAS